MGTADRRRTVLLEPIYDALEALNDVTLINWHSLTRCDTTGHIRGKGKKTCFNVFLASSPYIVEAIARLGQGDKPSNQSFGRM